MEAAGLRARHDETVAVRLALRRYFDLQFGSIWRDLSTVLPNMRGTIADVGCGAQPYRSLFDSSITYIGVDTDDAATDFGYEMRDVRRLDGERWPLADGEVDVVLSTETLEHVPNPTSFMSEAHRTIRPGGQLVLTVPGDGAAPPAGAAGAT